MIRTKSLHKRIETSTRCYKSLNPFSKSSFVLGPIGGMIHKDVVQPFVSGLSPDLPDQTVSALSPPVTQSSFETSMAKKQTQRDLTHRRGAAASLLSGETGGLGGAGNKKLGGG